MSKFIINKGLENKFTITIKQNGSTLPMELVSAGKDIPAIVPVPVTFTKVASVSVTDEINKTNTVFVNIYNGLIKAKAYHTAARVVVKVADANYQTANNAYDAQLAAVATIQLAEDKKVDDKTTTYSQALTTFNNGKIEYNRLVIVWEDAGSPDSGTEYDDKTDYYKLVFSNSNSFQKLVDQADTDLSTAQSTRVTNVYDANVILATKKGELVEAADAVGVANSEVLLANNNIVTVDGFLSSAMSTVSAILVELTIKNDAQLLEELVIRNAAADVAVSNWNVVNAGTTELTNTRNASTTAITGISNTTSETDELVDLFNYVNTISSVVYTYTRNAATVSIDATEYATFGDYYKVTKATTVTNDGISGDDSTTGLVTYHIAGQTGLTNTYTTLNVNTTLTLALDGVTADEFIPHIYKLEGNTEVTMGTAMTAVASSDSLTGQVILEFTDAGVNLLTERDRSDKVDGYYLRPVYRLALECKTNNNGDFVAKLPEVYVE